MNKHSFPAAAETQWPTARSQSHVPPFTAHNMFSLVDPKRVHVTSWPRGEDQFAGAETNWDASQNTIIEFEYFEAI